MTFKPTYPIVEDAIGYLRAFNTAKTHEARETNRKKYHLAVEVMTKPARDELFAIKTLQFPTLKTPL